MENISKELSAKAYIYNTLINLKSQDERKQLKTGEIKPKELSHKV
jgi:hypothetical protein